MLHVHRPPIKGEDRERIQTPNDTHIIPEKPFLTIQIPTFKDISKRYLASRIPSSPTHSYYQSPPTQRFANLYENVVKQSIQSHSSRPTLSSHPQKSCKFYLHLHVFRNLKSLEMAQTRVAAGLTLAASHQRLCLTTTTTTAYKHHPITSIESASD